MSPLVDISARDHGLSRSCSATIRVTPGEQATAAHKLANAIGGAVTGDPQVDAAAELLRAGGTAPRRADHRRARASVDGGVGRRDRGRGL